MNNHPLLKPLRNWPLPKTAFLLVVLLTAACGKAGIEPVEIAAEDMCAFCKMAISEKRYAAEFLNRDGDAFKFDDIGCLRNYVKTKQGSSEPAVYFVMDYDTQKWIKGRQAYFVNSPEFKTPMSGGIVAFHNRSRAEEMAAKYRGRLMNYGDLFGDSSKEFDLSK